MANKKKQDEEQTGIAPENIATVTPQYNEAELSGRKKMTKADAQTIVNHYSNISYKGMPADLKEAKELLAGK